MQAGGAAVEQALTESGHDIQAEFADGRTIIAICLQPFAYPAGNFSTAHGGKPYQAGVVGNRHDPGSDRNIYAMTFTIVQELKIAIRVEEILGGGAIGPRIDFLPEIFEFSFR